MWVKLTDTFLGDADINAIGAEAVALYIAGLVHCAGNLTDGTIQAASVRPFAACVGVADAHTAAKRLVQTGLWEKVYRGGKVVAFRVRNYLKYNKSRDQIESDREAGAQRIATWRERKSNAVTNGVRTQSRPVPVPSHGSPSVNLTVMSQPRVGTDEEAASASTRSKPNAAYSDPDFLRFWKVWSAFDTRDKLNAWKNWMTRTRQDRIAADDLVRAAEHYAADIAARPRELHVIMHASTFLGPGHRYSDYLEPPKVTPIRPGVAPIPNQRRAGRETTQEKLDRAFGRFAAEGTGRVAIGGGS